jgi:CHAT domain-containing protein/Tfp pilus assembly protein PilF
VLTLVACTVCVISAVSSVVPLGATGRPDGQQAVALPANSQENVSASLEEATQLQQEADRQIDARAFADAAEKTERALAVRRQYLGAIHPDVAYSLSRLGNIAYYQGQYERAEALISEALKIREATLGPAHLDVADSLNDLASILMVRADYVRPESMYQRALRIYETATASKGSAAPTANVQALIADVLNNLGRLYYTRGDFSRAESQYLKALAIREKASDEQGVAQALANVGGVYYSTRQNDKAVQVLQRALGIQETLLPPNHPSLATSNFNLAAVYFEQGNYASAERLFQRALAIDEEALDPNHPRLAVRLVGLAEVLRLEGEYARADPLYERALAIRERSLGTAHPDVAATLIGRSLLQYARGDVDSAIELMSRGADLRENTLAFVLTTGSEEQKRLFLRTLADETDIAVSLHLNSAPSSRAAARLALTSVVRRKGRSIDAAADQNASLRRHLTGTDREVLNRLTQAQSGLATMALRGVATDAQRQAVSALRTEIQQLEEAISTRNVEFRVASRTTTIDGIQESLPRGAALIEFFSYRPFSVRSGRDTVFAPPRYAAYVVRRDGIAGSVDLGDVARIDQQVRRFGMALSNPLDRGLRPAARALYGAVMAPLQDSLRDVEQLIIAPDGALNLIPFSALVEEPDTYLVERFTISYVTSGRDLTRLLEISTGLPDAASPPIIVANPLFDGPRLAAKSSPEKTAASRTFDAADLERQLQFTALPGTAQEAAEIARVLPDARLIAGAEANEAQVKGLKGPPILHIATHGFFLQTASKPPNAPTRALSALSPQAGQAVERQDALLRSGLALAGVNRRSSGDGEDGLLTALEVAGLDLWGTRLVVLSACETGVGDARNGEGVYGLRRALVLAGSESQVMTLWQVSDTATREFVVIYYQRLRAGEGRAEALRNVQLAMLRGKANRVHPFYWASFIESGDWRRVFD